MAVAVGKHGGGGGLSLSGILNGVGHLFHSAVNAINPLNDIANAIGAGVTWVMKNLGHAMGSTSQVTFGGRYVALYDLGLHLAILVALGALLYGVAAAALAGDMRRLTATLTRVVVAIIASFALLTLVLLAQSAIFQVDKGIAATFAASNRQVGASLSASLAVIVGPSVLLGAGPMIAILLGLVAILGGLILWAVLLMTTALTYVACFFAPLAFVVSAKAGKKILELLVAMLLTPFVITSIIAIGVAIIADSGGLSKTVPHFLMGTGLLYVAIFSPLALLRFLPVAEQHMASLRHPHQAVQGAHSQATSAFKRFSPNGKTGSGASASASSGSGAGAGAAANPAAAAVAGVEIGKAFKRQGDKVTQGSADSANAATSSTEQPAPGKTANSPAPFYGSQPSTTQSSPSQPPPSPPPSAAPAPASAHGAKQ
jgi:hypothetical protein